MIFRFITSDGRKILVEGGKWFEVSDTGHQIRLFEIPLIENAVFVENF